MIDNPVKALLNYIESNDTWYNTLKDDVYPNLDRRRRNKTYEKLEQILTTFIMNAAMDYAAKRGRVDEWKKLFPPRARKTVVQVLLDHYLKNTLPFEERKTFIKPATPTAPVPENPLELFGNVTKLVKRALFVLGDVSSEERFEKELGKLSRIELQLICDDLKLDREGDNETLKKLIIKDFYGS